jgi:hypothetical protein
MRRYLNYSEQKIILVIKIQVYSLNEQQQQQQQQQQLNGQPI